MLSHPTHERLISLGLPGMAKAFDDQRRSSDIAALSFEERIGLMVDREAAERDSKRLTTRLKFAALRQNAVVEDVDLRTPRGIDRALFQRLVAGDWINRAEGLLITGPTGVGKSWIACALGQKACRDGRSVIYHRVPRLFEALALARGDGRYGRLLKSLALRTHRLRGAKGASDIGLRNAGAAARHGGVLCERQVGGPLLSLTPGASAFSCRCPKARRNASDAGGNVGDLTSAGLPSASTSSLRMASGRDGRGSGCPAIQASKSSSAGS